MISYVACRHILQRGVNLWMQSKGICLIEWGEIIKDALPKEYIKIEIEKDELDENKRILSISSIGNKYENLLNTLKEEF